MEQRTSYLIVGVFVLAAAAVTVGFIVWIAGGRATESLETYTVVFDRDVSGLSLGSPVRYLGVDVGEVIAMDLITDRGTRVAAQVSVAASTPIHGGTYASLAYQGMTGVAFINLAADPGEFPPLTADTSSEYPVIPTQDVGLAALLAQSGNITAEVSTLLDQASHLVGEDNQASLRRTLANLDLLTETLAGEQETIAALPQRLLNGLDELRDMVKRIRSLLDQAQPDVLAATKHLSAATGDIAELTDRLHNWFGSNEEELDAFASAGLGELPGLVAEARGSLRELDKLVISLREDPSKIIYRPRQNAVQVEP